MSVCEGREGGRLVSFPDPSFPPCDGSGNETRGRYGERKIILALFLHVTVPSGDEASLASQMFDKRWGQKVVTHIYS